LAGAVFAGAFAVVAFARSLVATLAVTRVLLAARLAAADPLADLAADERFAGVLVAVRFAGSTVAGVAFVAATYTLSVCVRPGRGAPHRKVGLSNFGG
jgi:hypothetical protein